MIRKNDYFLFIISLLLVILGFIFLTVGARKIKRDIYFRKTFGFLGISNDSRDIKLPAFNVDNFDLSFIIDQNLISFDDNNVISEKCKIKDSTKIQNIESFALVISVSLKHEKAQISKLYINKKAYDIGLINLEKINNSKSLSYGVTTSFLDDSLYSIKFIDDGKNFKITELVFYNEKINSFKTNPTLPLIVKSERRNLKVNVNFNVDEDDVFMLVPIFKGVNLDDNTTFLFVPSFIVEKEKTMDYFEIREYIKKC